MVPTSVAVPIVTILAPCDERSSRTHRSAKRVQLVAVEGGEVIGYVAVVPLHGWSSHVGEVRVIVDPDRRGRGIGRALARHAVLGAVELELRKMVVEVVADQEPTIAMFRSLGFDPEALLTDHVRDQSGALRDLMILAHSVQEQWSSMAVAGITDEL